MVGGEIDRDEVKGRERAASRILEDPT